MRPTRTRRAPGAIPFESLGSLLSSHRGTTRVVLAALSFALIIALSTQAPVIQAGPHASPLRVESLLPQPIGAGIATDAAVTISFDSAMNPGSVESALQVLPDQPVDLAWNEELDELSVSAERQWRTDETYVLVVGTSAERTDGRPVGGPARYSFTTRTAPTVSDFQVHFAIEPAAAPTPPAEADAKVEALREADADAAVTDGAASVKTAQSVSASSAITVSFSDEMDRADVEGRFAITPEVDGDLSWEGGDLVFTPSERMTPGARYTVSVIGAHDVDGNVLGGKGNFSFIVQDGAQVTRTEPETNAVGVTPATVEIWFSEPMDPEATNSAFELRDTSTGALVGGHLNWNEAKTQLTFAPDAPLAGGRSFALRIGDASRDVDGNAVEASIQFTTAVTEVVAPPTPAPRGTASTRTVTVPAPAPATSLAGHALNQVNAARAAYGFAPVVLDANISAAASAHAWDQARNGYFSHYGQNGSSRETRLRAAGVSFTYSGENQCYHLGMTERETLDWCHAQFMAEPYPGHWNHIANILDPRFKRMGVGIASAGGRVVITWNFTD